MVKNIIKKIYRIIDNILNKLFFNEYFFQRQFLDILNSELDDCKTILEIGSGKSTYLTSLNKKFCITAIDISIEQLRESKRANVYDYYIRGDVSQINNLIKAKSFDAVVAMDLIEHLNKEEGLTLIKNLSNIVREKIIIYTPNGFLFQPPSVNNPYQEHKSGWTYKEMEQLGFDVIGVNGYKRLTGLYAVPIVKPNALGVFIRNISVIILKIIRREDLSYAILCVKSI